MIEHRSAVIVSAIECADQLGSFIGRFPLCEKRPVSWASVSFSATVAFDGVGIAHYDDQEVLESAILRSALGLATDGASGYLKLATADGVLIVRDDFEHVISSFLHQLPLKLCAGEGMLFEDHYDGPDGIDITLVDGIVLFDDLHSNLLRAPLREVLVVLADANARFSRIMSLAESEAN